jgi:hypothetical protein
LAAGAVLVSLRLAKEAPPYVELFLWITLGVLLTSAFFWPRCPHCRTRVVQFNKLEWVPGDACWRCHRPYDEIETPAYEIELSDVVLKAFELRKKDPATAERLLAEGEAAYEIALAKEMAGLRERASVDPIAAKTLRSRLKSQLKGLANTGRALQKTRRTNPQAEIGLQNIRALEQAARQELVGLEARSSQINSSTQ